MRIRLCDRVPQREPTPHPIVACFFFFIEKRILRLRRGHELEYKGHKKYIFSDFMPEVMQQRWKFNEVQVQPSRFVGNQHGAQPPLGFSQA